MSARREPTVTRWWWVRHAPVINHGKRLYGQNDVAANTSDNAAFERLARTLPREAVWVTSHLSRTKQTAAAIAEVGHPLPEPQVETDLAEQHFGAWEGLTFAELAAAKDGAYHKFWIAPAHQAAPGGETFVAVVARVADAVGRLNAQHAGRDIVAVAHGGSIRAALSGALEIDPERALSFAIDNLSLTRIDHIDGPGEGGAWRVVAVNLPARPN